MGKRRVIYYNEHGERYCCGWKRKGLPTHYVPISEMIRKEKAWDHYDNICKSCLKVKNSFRHGPDALPEYAISSKRGSNIGRARRKMAFPEWIQNDKNLIKKIDAIYQWCHTLNKCLSQKFEVHHYKPIAVGGLHHPDNLIVITKSLNQKIGASWERSQQHLSQYFRDYKL